MEARGPNIFIHWRPEDLIFYGGCQNKSVDVNDTDANYVIQENVTKKQTIKFGTDLPSQFKRNLTFNVKLMCLEKPGNSEMGNLLEKFETFIDTPPHTLFSEKNIPDCWQNIDFCLA